jgi:membrane associated rhomboid family serine protease
MSLNLILLISIGAVSYISFSNAEMFRKLLFNPYTIIREKQWYRFISSAWLHGDMMHLFVNLYILYSFGNYLEMITTTWFGGAGSFYYLFLFVGSVIIGHIPSYIKHKDNYSFSSVGASGGVSGILFACILVSPLMQLRLFFAIPINSLIFGVLYLAYTWYMSKKGGDIINHDAHLWGALGGMILLIAIKPVVLTNFFSQLLNFLPG